MAESEIRKVVKTPTGDRLTETVAAPPSDRMQATIASLKPKTNIIKE